MGGRAMSPSALRPTPSAPPADWPPTRYWLRRTDFFVLPAVFVVDVLVFSTLLRGDAMTTAGRVAVVCYSAVGVGLLLFRRLAPVPVYCAVWVHAVLALLLSGGAYSPVFLLLVAIEAVAETRTLKVSLLALGAGLVPAGLLVSATAREASAQATLTAAVGSALFYCGIGALSWWIGRWVRRYQLRLNTLQAKHTQEVQEQREEAENAVSAERLRIARELHDIVAHSVTIMVLHAAGAKRVVDDDPARAKESLTTIEESGQQAMGELRRLLQLLRDEGEPAGSGAPLPGLAQLDPMISSVRGSGVDVTLDVTGEPSRLDASIDRAAYRLVQEGLTNVSKHRGVTAHAMVSIDWGAEKMTIAVEDDGLGSDTSQALSTGNGLAGLRERIAIAGGEFVAGPTDAGGFRVAARLPLSDLPVATVPPDPPRPATLDDEGPHRLDVSGVAESDLVRVEP